MNEAVSFDYENLDIERPFDFTSHTSIGCGGLAKLAIYPRKEGEMVDVIRRLTSQKTPWVVVGNLTNTLPSDLGTDKVVICTKKMTELRIEDAYVYAAAGVQSGKLLKSVKENSLSGLEFLTGIPCTIGGALYMNAGAGGIYLSERVQSVRVLREGKVKILSKEECDYRYKHSLFMDNQDVILGGTFALKKSTYADVLEVERFYRASRAHLPKGKSMGCIFKNPAGQSAGELIEKTGLKNLRVGGAIVSPDHANFIINDGNATAREVRALIKLIQNAVFAYCGVALEEEIQYLD
ncbi:MAG: UDP-N-acetylmuramate dehydrogenase [Clostridia bacterium]|nr:UDP-N-acetylmuramate dehydrogenase [Clostridia bacterium]